MIKIIKKIEKPELKEFLYNIDLKDENLYKELNESQLGIFQFSGSSSSGLINRVKPVNFEEANVINAAARPGTINFIDDYIKNQDGAHKKYPEQIHELIESSRGVIFFQEQIMSIFNKVGGFTLEECICGDEKILTDIGEFSIKYIVENKMDVNVLSFNEDKKIFEWKKIINYFDKGKKEIIELELEDGSILKCTPEHKIYTNNRGWVEANFLLPEDDIVVHHIS